MSRNSWSFVLILLFIILYPASPLSRESATPPLLDEKILENIANEVSGSVCFEHIRYLSTLHRIWGSKGYHQAAQYLVDKCVEYGLKEAKIEQYPLKTEKEFWKYIGGYRHLWDLKSGELRLVEPYPMLLTHSESAPTTVARGSLSTNTTAELVYIGRGDAEKDYEVRDVNGKIVLFESGSGMVVHELAVHKHGALGTIRYTFWPQYPEESEAVRDLPIWPYRLKDKKPTFGFNVSQTQGLFLKELLEKGERVVVTARVDAEMKEDGSFELPTAVIPGSTHPEEEFILYAHLDHPKPGAHDNASGCAVLMEIARTLSSLIQKKIIPPPMRTIRFLWVPHMTGLYMYYLFHPEKIGRVMGGCNFDCVGADPAKYPLKLYVSLPPGALPTVLTDITNNVIAHYISKFDTSIFGGPAKDLLFSPEGSRNMFSMTIRPNRGGGSDQDLAHTWPLKIPSIYFYDWPMPPRHSQVNFLDYMDRTQLRRISFLGAVIAYAFTTLDENSAPRLLNEIQFRGENRLRRELLMAKDLLGKSTVRSIHKDYHKGVGLLNWAEEREKGVLKSLNGCLSGPEALGELFAAYSQHLDRTKKECLGQLRQDYVRLCHSLKIKPADKLEEKRDSYGQNIIPTIHLELKAFPGISRNYLYFQDKLGEDVFKRYEGVRDALWIKGLKDSFLYIDGRKTLKEIYDAVQSELWSGGYTQRYRVSFEIMTEYFRLLKDAGIILFKE